MLFPGFDLLLHSDYPNVNIFFLSEVEGIDVPGLFLFAKRPIRVGEEVRLGYYRAEEIDRPCVFVGLENWGFGTPALQSRGAVLFGGKKFSLLATTQEPRAQKFLAALREIESGEEGAGTTMPLAREQRAFARGLAAVDTELARAQERASSLESACGSSSASNRPVKNSSTPASDAQCFPWRGGNATETKKYPRSEVIISVVHTLLEAEIVTLAFWQDFFRKWLDHYDSISN